MALIVDDCELMRRLIKALNSRVADVIVECASGDAAYAACPAHRPDWVLMAIQLPGLDGVAAIWRALPRGASAWCPAREALEGARP